MEILALFVSGDGRIARGTMFYRLIILAALCAAFGTLGGELAGNYGSAAFAVIFVWCACALFLQRLHDIGRSGWALLFLLIPVLGPLWLITQLLKRGVEGSNRYGKDPMARSGYLTVDISL
ncbi:DUF805 domain-containing protein [Undibacterium terreum]|uniref:DUF805 domain-containing protein n=1 Tax=Undibacterium terreum TaxID=1224302 RepID=A0A916U6J2_9BURK|nr:DUF805 domain-containing protein [Undibacterium terreum]GGC61661.1 hypothetical protein GCM10011396_05780 [Undibacterium terreum]